MKMFAKDNDRGHVNERMKSNFANNGRIAGMGMCYDNYSEDSFPDTITYKTGTPAHKPLTKEEKDFMLNGGEVKIYRLSKAELVKMGYIPKY